MAARTITLNLLLDLPMGIFFTLLYILTAYLSPTTLFGPLAAYHIEIIIAVIAVVVSLPALFESRLLRLPQTLAIAGMTFAVFASLAASGWLGGAPTAVYDFLPNVFIYFLIVLHCKTIRHLQLIVLTLLAMVLFVTVQGWLALRGGEETSLYLMRQGISEGVAIFRLRGLSFISDPNDFAQVLVSLLPCMFFFWKKGASLRNLGFVFLPLGLLVYSMFLTHSRGAVVAMLVVVIVAGRRKVGTVPALMAAGLMFAAASAVGWSGAAGRDISVEGGEDRMEAWATGLELIRSHPLFGVGLFRFTDYYPITAHNTIVVCAAELGFVGFFFWILFVLCSLRYGATLSPGKKKPVKSKDKPVLDESESLAGLVPASAGIFHSLQLSSFYPHGPAAEAASGTPGDASFPDPDGSEFATESEDTPAGYEEEVRRLAGLMVVTLSGYLTAGWFLSRAYVMTLYIYGGMTQVLFTMAVDHRFAPPTATLPRLLWWSGCVSVLLLLLVYAILRLKNLVPAG